MKIISFRLNENDLNRIDNTARRFSMTRAEVLRNLICDQLDRIRPLNLSKKEHHTLIISRNLSLIKLGKLCTLGSNLSNKWTRTSENINQIAKELHKTGHLNESNLQTFLDNTSYLMTQNERFNKGVTKIWQLLELPIQKMVSRQ